MTSISITAIIVAVIIVAVVIIIIAIAQRYKIPDANEALIITGSKGSAADGAATLKIVMGAGAFILPFVQKCRVLSLDATEIAMQVPEGVSKDNIKVVVDAVALAKIDGTPAGVRSAAQRFLGREDQIPRIIQSILAGALRGVVGNMTIEEMLRDREGLATKIQDAASSALSDAGLKVDTLQINGISTDPADYITNLGRPQAAEVRKSAEVAEAMNEQEAARAKAEARIQIASANKDAQLKEAGFLKETSQADAEAQAVGPMTKAAQDALITQAQQQNAQQIATLTKLQLDSDVRAKADASLYAAQKAADAELYTAEQRAKAQAVQVTAAAEAEQTRLTREGDGRASATKASGLAEATATQARLTGEGDGQAAATKAAGLAEAEAIRAKGLAEAEAIKAKGTSEAQVREMLAQAYAQYGQQAIIDRVLSTMPDMLAAAAKPIGDVDSITVIGGAEAAGGVTRLSTEMLVKLPAVIKAATGLDVVDLMHDWFATGKAASAAEDAPVAPVAPVLAVPAEAPTAPKAKGKAKPVDEADASFIDVPPVEVA
ncbi:MAG: SPFH domain-containing protein [Actinomycetia bacterium]|nr:SPFH domain-containing protein [Actinomycetes bacterium]